jgi:hypothetical protein
MGRPFTGSIDPLLHQLIPWDRIDGQALLQLHQHCRKRVLGYVTLVVDTYQSLLQTTHESIDGTQATLSLLHYLVLFHNEPSVRLIVIQTIESSPLQAWQHLIPQLMALVTHWNPFVSTAIVSILVRMAQQWPETIVFAIIVHLARASRLKPVIEVLPLRLVQETLVFVTENATYCSLV